MKRTLLFLVALVLVLSASASAAEVEYSAPGEFPIVSEPITLKVCATMPLTVEDPYTNTLTKYIEEKTNIQVEWQLITQDAQEKISLMMASGETLPDIILPMGNMSNEQVVAYGAEGLFIPLNDLIEKEGVNVKALFDYNSTVKGAITAPDGNIYGIPHYGECYHCYTSQKMWLNTTWLDNLGLKAPTTIDEYYDMLVAFKEQDANGNGDPSDEVPLVMYYGGWMSSPDMFIMNAFEYNAGEAHSWLKLEDEKIEASFVTDGWKEGLRFMRKLYEEGLMDAEAFVTSQEQVYLLSADAKGNRVGSFPGGVISNGVNLSSERAKEYAALAPLEGPDGLKQAVRYYEDLDMRFFITKDCQYPEIAYKWGDMFMINIVEAMENGNYEGEIFLDGTEGGIWERAAEGELGMDGRPALYKWTDLWGQPHNTSWGQLLPIMATYEYKLYMASAVQLGGVDQEKILFESTRDDYEPYWTYKTVPKLMMDRDAAIECAEIKANIVDYVKESFANFTLGVWDVDADWDAYLAQFDAMGLNRLLELSQSTYDGQYGK